MKNLLAHTSLQVPITQGRGMSGAFRAARAHKGSPYIQRLSCLALEALMTNNPENKQNIVSLNGVEWFVEVITFYKSDEEVLLGAIRALRILMPNRSTQTRVRKAGAIPLILEAMRTYQDALKLQEQCCWFVRNTAYSHKENQAVLLEVGAPDSVLEAMSRFLNEETIQRQGVNALRSMVSGNATVQAKATSWISAVTLAMKTHLMSARMQEDGCWALRDLVADSPENRQVALSCDAVKVIQAAQLTHEDDRALHRISTEALTFLK